MAGDSVTRNLTMDFAREMRAFMDKQDARQEEMLKSFGEIQVQLERQGQLAVRMNYIEKDINEMKKRLETVDKDISGLRKELATLAIRFGEISAQMKERTRFQEKGSDRAYGERRDLRHQIQSLVMQWGPWIGILFLLGKDLLK